MASDIDRAVADRLLTTARAVRRRLDLDRSVAHHTGEGLSPATRPLAESVAHWDGWFR